MSAKQKNEKKVQTWRHSRKGVMTGTIVREDGEWVDIEMASEGMLTLLSAGANGYYAPGDVITVRKSFLTEIV